MQGWQRVVLLLPAELQPALEALLTELGTLGVEERLPGGAPLPAREAWVGSEEPGEPGGRWREWHAYFPLDGRESERLQRLHALLASWPGAELRDGRLHDGEWEEDWKRRFHALSFRSFALPGASRRELVVAPPWGAPPGALLLEPGVGFGTGEHPSTRDCIRGLLSWGREGARCLDVGCGSGILSLVAARLGMDALGVDVDPAAVEAARTNAERNGLAARFQLVPPRRSLRELEPRELVVANIFAEVLLELAPDLLRLAGERLLLAGILAEKEPVLRAAFSALELEFSLRDGPWVFLAYRRRGAA